MSTFESGYGSLLQGVSQQNPRERLPGQVQAQSNMLSDPVTGLRRRPGAKVSFNMEWPGASTDTLRAWYADVGGQRVHVLVNTSNGDVRVLEDANPSNVVADIQGVQYLIAQDSSSIRSAVVGGEFFLANTEQMPELVFDTAGIDPARQGYFYVLAGAFDTRYEATVNSAAGQYTAVYTTPSADQSGAADQSTPTYIASQLRNELAGQSTVPLTVASRTGTYVYLRVSEAHATLTVSSDTGSSRVVVSNDSYVREAEDLPARLPNSANNYIVAVGSRRQPEYYRYDSDSQAWLEAGSFDSPQSITNMPIVLVPSAGTFAVSSEDYEGRFAGDEESSPTFHFIDEGITGISSYQGRLVILSGAFVAMSASDRPRRFYRSTVTELLDSDPIEVGSSATTSAAYEYAVPFMRDLVLFSSTYQAIVPSTGSAITPRTANVVPTSSHATDMTSMPVPVGRTLMYAVPRSEAFFGVFEMVPSQYTESQYVSVDTSQHIPKLMHGRCRFGASSGVSGVALFGPSGDKSALVVHEYLWDADAKQQQSWHTWNFTHEIATAYFARESIFAVFAQNGVVVGCTVDPRAGGIEGEATKPYADMYEHLTVQDGEVQPPSWWNAFGADFENDDFVLVATTGDLAGSEIGFTYDAQTGMLNTLRSFQNGEVALGIRYRSVFAPTQPQVRDRNEMVITTDKMTVLRFIVHTQNSGEFMAAVTDRSGGFDPYNVGTLYWSSAELELGSSQVAGQSTSVVPARTRARSTLCELSTDSTLEFNVVAVDYVARYNQKIRRR